MDRHGRQAGAKEMIALVQLGRTHGQARLRAAIERALALGCTDGAAVRHLLTAPDLEHGRPPALAGGALAHFERALPDVAPYDQLLRLGARP